MFEVTSEHDALRAMVRKVLTDRSPESAVRALSETEHGLDCGLWRELGELGLLGLTVPAEFGGAGCGRTELGIVMEEVGRSLACVPMLSSAVLATDLLMAVEDADARRRLLPALVAGSMRAAVAVADRRGTWTGLGVQASKTDGGYVLDGEKAFVLDGHSADVLLVYAEDDCGATVYEVTGDARGLERTTQVTLDVTRRLAQLRFAQTPATPLGHPGRGGQAVESVRDLASAALAAECAGAAGRVLEMAVEHARTRVQFGRTIGSFQAIKHMCADMMVESESAISAARYVCECADTRIDEFERTVDLAHFYCAESFVRLANANIQIHGGIGFTWEHPAHLYLRRARSNAYLLGSPRMHRERFLTRTYGTEQEDRRD